MTLQTFRSEASQIISSRKGERQHLALGAILALGFLLRVMGIQFGLPYLYHADEPIVVNHALAYGTGDLNPHFFNIPPLVSYLLFLVYGFSYLVGRGIGLFQGVSDFESLFLSDPTFFYLLARFLFGVFAGTASIFLLSYLLQRHFPRELALLSAFFLAVAFLHVRDSHYVYVDIPLVLVLILCFFPILDLAEGKGGRRHDLVAGALAGLATAIKYNGILVLIPYVVATLLNPWRKRVSLGWLVAGGATVAVYTLANPFSWLDFKFFWQEITEQAAASGGIGLLHHLTYSLNGGVGPLLLASGVLGVFSGLRQREKKRVVLISFLISYYLVLVFRSQPYDRYVLPLLPFFLFFSADFILLAGKKISRRLRGKVIFFLVLVVAFPPLTKSVLSDLLFVKKDLRSQVKEWMEAFLEPGARLALEAPFLMPRLNFSREQLEEKLRAAKGDPHFSKAQVRRLEFLLAEEPEKAKKRFHLYFLSQGGGRGFLFSEPHLPFDLSQLKEKRIDYVFIARVQKEHRHPEFYDELRKGAKLVKRFTPYRDPRRESPFDRQPLTGGPFLWKELIARERNGQPIEVYQLK